MKSFNPWHRFFHLREQVVLSFIVLAGMIIRLWVATQNNLWRDEVYNYFSSKENSFIDLLLQNHWDTLHSSFYFVFLYFWRQLSIDPNFIRLPSLLLSIVIMVLIPILCKKMFPKITVFPFITLVLYAFSPAQISLNVVARPYPYIIVLIICSLLLFTHIIHHTNLPRKYIWFFSLVSSLIWFTDYSGVWLLIVYILYLIIYKLFYKPDKVQMKNILHISFFSFFFSLPWVILFILRLPNTLFISTNTYAGNFIDPIGGNLWQLAFFANILHDHILIQKGLLNATIISSCIILISFLGIVVSGKENKKNSLLLALLAIVPFFVSFLFSIVVSPIFIGRNLHIVNFVLLIGLCNLIT